MNKSVLMIMGGALLIVIIVAMVVQLSVSSKSKTEVVASGVEVLVAARTLTMGEAIKPIDVKWQSFPDAVIFTGMVKKKDQADETKMEIYGKPLRRDIQVGEPVTMQSVITEAKGSGTFLSAAISPGMRAVGIPVKAETTAGGFMSPGDFVDVILTYQLNLKGDAENYSSETVQRFASETILSNIRILAVDQNAKEDSREAKIARTVTVEVTKEGAQVLAMASTMGDITLSLRRLGEKDTDADKKTSLTTDVTTSQVIQRIYQIMDKSKTTSDTVRLYNGSAVVNVPVRAAQ